MRGSSSGLLTLLDEKENLYDKNAFKIKRISSVGAGDSMVAGFIAGYEMFNDYEKAIKMGIAAATATANSIFLAKREDIYKLFKKEEN